MMILWCCSSLFVWEMSMKFSPQLFFSLLVCRKVDWIGKCISDMVNLSKHIHSWLLSGAESLGRHPIKGIFGAIGDTSVCIINRLSLLSSNPTIITRRPLKIVGSWNAFPLSWATHIKLGSHRWSVAILLHAFWKILMETHIVRHILELWIAEVFGDVIVLVWSWLFHEEDKLWIIWSLLNTLEMQRIVDLLLCLKNLVYTEVVMSLFKCVKCDIFVIFVELCLWYISLVSHIGYHICRFDCFWWYWMI